MTDDPAAVAAFAPAPSPLETWKERLRGLHLVALTGMEIEDFTDVLVEAVGDRAGDQLLNLLNRRKADYVGPGALWRDGFRRIVEDASGGRLGPNAGIRDVFLAAFDIAPGNVRLLAFGERLAARTKLPAGAAPGTSGPATGHVLLEPRYALPIAEELAAFFGADPADLTILGLAADAPPAPANGTTAAWTTWLGRCTAAQLETVLRFVALRNKEKARATQHHLERRLLLAEHTLSDLDKLDRDNVVVDRKQLAGHLEPMLQGSKLILRVEGERYLGKSFTRSILRAILERGSSGGDHVVIDVDVAGVTLSELATKVLRAMQVDPALLPDAADSTGDKWPERVAEVIVREAMRPKGLVPPTYWLVFDRCAGVSKEDELGQFLRRLGQEVDRYDKEDRVPRIVLIEGSESLTARRRRVLLEERLLPIVKGDIASFFREKKLEDAKADDRADDVHRAMSAVAEARRLEEMQERILDILDEEGAS